MPYKIKINEKTGERCVINSETSEEKGCHKTHAEALDQMKALYAAEGVEKGLEELEKCYPEYSYNPYAAISTLAELDQLRAAKELSHEIDEQLWDYRAVFDAIWQNQMLNLSDKIAKSADLVNEFLDRVKKYTEEDVSKSDNSNPAENDTAQKVLENSDRVEKEWQVVLDTTLTKSNEKRLAYGVVLKPNEFDAQGDIITVDEIEKLNKEVKKRRIDLDNPENNRRVAVDRIEFRRSLLEKSRTESSKSRTGYVVEKNIDRIVDHVFKNIEVYGVENIDLIGGYIFEALVELELSDTDSKLSQDLIGVLSARPENRNVDFKLSSEEVKRVEELYTVYSKENGNSHADKLCIGNNISIRKIAGLIEIKKASSSDISEEYVSQVLKSAKNLNSFISWINSNPTLKSGEKILIGKFEQAAWNNMAIFIVEPHQEGDRGNRSFRRQEFNIHLLRSIIDSKVIHEIATAVVGDLKKSPGQA